MARSNTSFVYCLFGPYSERNHAARKRVHSLTRVRLLQHKVESGTAIALNGKQMERRVGISRDDHFSMWWSGLGRRQHGAEPEVEDLDEEEEEMAQDICEFDRVGSGGNHIDDSDLFETEILEEGTVAV